MSPALDALCIVPCVALLNLWNDHEQEAEQAQKLLLKSSFCVCGINLKTVAHLYAIKKNASRPAAIISNCRSE